MTIFEKFLLDNGYKKHFYNPKTKQNELTDKHIISTIVNLDHRYIKGDSIFYFGLHEKGKPPTLISPRPRISVRRNGIIEDERMDDSMNIVLSKENPLDIFNAIFDTDKVFEYDLGN